MKKILIFIIYVGNIVWVTTTHAQDSSNWYLTTSYSFQNISNEGGDLNTINGSVGYKINNYFSIETRVGVGTSGYSREFLDIGGLEGDELVPVRTVEHDIETQVALLLKAFYPLTDKLHVYAVAGGMSTKSEVKVSGNLFYDGVETKFSSNSTNTDKGLTYGAGLSYQFNDDFSLFVDYQILPEFEPNQYTSKDWDSINMGGIWRF